MAKAFIKRLIDRNNENTAILVIGSGLQLIKAPGLNIYAATKRFVNYLCRAIGNDFDRQNYKVRVICYDSGAVKTNMTKNGFGANPEEAEKA